MEHFSWHQQSRFSLSLGLLSPIEEFRTSPPMSFLRASLNNLISSTNGDRSNSGDGVKISQVGAGSDGGNCQVNVQVVIKNSKFFLTTNTAALLYCFTEALLASCLILFYLNNQCSCFSPGS